MLIEKDSLRKIITAPQTSFILSFLHFYTGKREPSISYISFEERL